MRANPETVVCPPSWPWYKRAMMTNEDFEDRAAIAIMAALISDPKEVIFKLDSSLRTNPEAYAAMTWKLVDALAKQRKALGKSEK